MITAIPAASRGVAEHGWLSSRHTFSFADYYNPQRLGFGPLRVINEDRVAPGRGFGRHPHRDMEIISVVIDGQLAHADSMGTGSVILPGEVQIMSAGTGVTHSEQNPSPDTPVHFLQIWILPARGGLTPSYAQRAFPEQPGLTLLLSPDGEDQSLIIHQDVRLFRARPQGDTPAVYTPGAGRWTYLHLVKGELAVAVGDQPALALTAGDALAIDETAPLRWSGEGEALIFDLPPTRGATR